MRFYLAITCLLCSVTSLGSTITDFIGSYRVVSSACQDHAGNKYSNPSTKIDFEISANGSGVIFRQVYPTLIKEESWEQYSDSKGNYANYSASPEYDLTYTEHFGPQGDIKWYNRFFGLKREATHLIFYQEYTQEPDVKYLFNCVNELERL